MLQNISQFSPREVASMNGLLSEKNGYIPRRFSVIYTQFSLTIFQSLHKIPFRLRTVTFKPCIHSESQKGREILCWFEAIDRLSQML